ncbi:MAG: phage tail tape measure protein [Pseudomonadota bacterium]
MRDLSRQSYSFGASFTGAVRSAITSGKNLESTLKSIARGLSNVALSAALKPVQYVASNAFSTLFSSLGGTIANARGNVINSNGVVPFANGGVVSQPSYFQAGSSLAVMGEAGPEAILPLARGRDGKLGVRSQRSEVAPTIVFNISTPDASSFRRSEGQLTAMLARTVNRGHRNL